MKTLHTLKKEGEDIEDGRPSGFMDWQDWCVTMSLLPKVVFRCDTILIKISVTFSTELEKHNLKIHIKTQMIPDYKESFSNTCLQKYSLFLDIREMQWKLL